METFSMPEIKKYENGFGLVLTRILNLDMLSGMQSFFGGYGIKHLIEDQTFPPAAPPLVKANITALVELQKLTSTNSFSYGNFALFYNP